MARFPVEIRYEMEFAKHPLRGLRERVVASETIDLDIQEVVAAKELVRGSVRDDSRRNAFDFEVVEFGGRTWARRDAPGEEEGDIVKLLARHVGHLAYDHGIPYKVARHGARPRASLVGRSAIVEDGRDEAVTRCHRAIGDLLLVGGRLYQPGFLPEWRVGRMRNLVSESNQVYLTTCFNDYGFPPCGRFPYDRLDEAVAFSRTLHDSFRGDAAWLAGDTKLCGSTLEISQPAPEIPRGRIASHVWREIAPDLERLEVFKLGYELLTVYHAAETASRTLDIDPGDAAALASLEASMRTLAEWKVEGKTIVPTTLDRLRPVIETYELHGRMTETLDADDIAALAP